MTPEDKKFTDEITSKSLKAQFKDRSENTSRILKKLNELVPPDEIKITNFPEPTATNELLAQLVEEAKKKSESDIEIEIDREEIKGDKGDPGKDGVNGRDGLDGKDGQNGVDGIDGKDGEAGLNGGPDSPLQIKDKLENLFGTDRLNASAIQGLKDLDFSFLPRTLDALYDVNLSVRPTNNQTLVYNASINKWIAGSGVSIGGTITGGTAGSVLFINPSGILAQDNAAFNWNDSTKVLTTGQIQVVTGNNAYALQATDGTVKTSIFNGTVSSLLGGFLGTDSNHPLSFYTNSGSAALTILPGGNVGVGIANPTAKFHVSGSMVLQNTTARWDILSTTGTNPAFFTFNNTGGTGYWGQQGSVGNELVGSGGLAYSTALVAVASNSYGLQLATGAGNTARITILGTGQVGIGRNDPLVALDVIGNSRISGYFTGTGGLSIYGDNSSSFGLTLQTGGNLGIAVTSPTAVLHLKAGTASANTAPLKFNSGTNLTTPEVGAVEYDTNNFYLTKKTALRESIPGVLFTQTATQTVSNVGETTLFGSGVGTLTLPANTLVAGKTIRIMGAGVFSTQAVPGNVTIKIYLGTTVIATGTITNILALAANNAFEFMAEITCRTTGATGTVMTNGNAGYDTGVLVQGVLALNNAGATTTIDTTASQAIDVKLTWATQIAANTISTTTASVEILN